MKRCPITYEIISPSENYSKKGLHLLSPKLNDFKSLAYSAEQQRMEAIARAGKMSIQGVQTKLSAKLSIKENSFELVEQKGQYILKPQSVHYPELPENEALTMSLASMIGIEIPVHGLVYSIDNSMTYFVKRFDRFGKNKKLALEDFAQLSGFSRETKYNSSMENVAKVIKNFCSFPLVESLKLFKLTLFNYLIGNEDMHLKNFSLITRNHQIQLSPAYDLLNTSIVLPGVEEEFALPLNGKKRNFRKKDFINYYGVEKLNLNSNVINNMLNEIEAIIPAWQNLIENSFLSTNMKQKYLQILSSRQKQIFI